MTRMFREVILLSLIAFATAAFSPQALAQEADLSIDKTGPATAAAGSTIAYSIVVTNLGPDDAAGVSWSDTLPAGTTFVSLSQVSGSPVFTCTTRAVGATAAVDCTAASLASGTSASFTLQVAVDINVNGTFITNVATVASSTVDPNSENDSAAAVTLVGSFADLAVAKTGPARAFAGDTLVYAITLSNQGPGAAQTVSLDDPIPAGVTFVSFAQSSGPAFSCTTPAPGGAAAVSCTIATLSPGAIATFELAGVVGPGLEGTVLTNTATATASSADPDPDNNSGSAFTDLPFPTADIVVTKTAPASVAPGANVSYAIGLSNQGPDAAQSVVLDDVLPAGTTFVSLTQTSGPGGFACTAPAPGSGGAVSCSLATLASGAAAAFTLVAKTSPGAAGTTITNTATASTATTDPAAANNTASARTTVALFADLALTKAGPASVASGADITYTLGVMNNGPDAAQSTTWSDALPAGTTLVSFAQSAGPGFTCTVPAAGANGTVTCTIAAMPPGASAAFVLVARSGSAGTRVTNTASVNSATGDPNPANNSASTTSTVSARQGFTGPSATGTGNITASFTGGGASCSYASAEFIPLTGHPRSPPAGSAPPGIAFPHGLFDFTISGCTPGSTLAFTIVYPAALPAGTAYWKYGPTPGNATATWYQLPASVSGDTVTFAITDGGLGDDDRAVNGTIVDQGGPGVPAAALAPRQVPTLSEWMQILLAMMMLAGGLAAMRRRRAQ